MGNLTKVVSLIKFVREEKHALDFLSGNLFCRPWIFFKDIEDNQRGDKLELAASKLQSKIYLKTANIIYNTWLENKDDYFSPVFCMYSVFSRKLKSPAKLKLKDEDLRGFGNYGVVIKNTKEFINRLRDNLPGFSYGLIEYIDFYNLNEQNQHALRKPILQKDFKKFGHQQEFRIYNSHYAITNDSEHDIPIKKIIEPNELGAKTFPIGNLSDIAEIYSMDELFMGIEVDIENPINKKAMSKELWWDGEKYREVI